MADYWQRVHREALGRAFATVGGSIMNAVGALLGVVGAFWSLFFFGSSDAADDLAIERVALFVASIAWLVFLYVHWIKRVPEEWDEQQRQRIATLEDERRPQLLLVSGNERIFRHKLFKDNQKTTYLRLGITNTSASQTIEDVEVILANVVSEATEYTVDISRKLQFLESDEFQTNINPGDTKYFRLTKTHFARYISGATAHLMTFGPFPYGNEVIVKEAGPLIAKLRISGRNMRVGLIRCRITFDAEAVGTCELVDSKSVVVASAVVEAANAG